jgi:hypothetical protein
MKKILFLLGLVVCLSSCEELKSKLNWETPSIESDEEIVSPDDEEEGDTTFVSSNSDGPRTKNFYASLLDSFCQANFNEHFEGDNYENGSLVVVKIADKGNNQVEVSGTHSFKTDGAKVIGQMFKATIIEKGDNLFDITFEKGSSKVLSDKSYWDSIQAEYHYE